MQLIKPIKLDSDCLFKTDLILEISPKDGMYQKGADESYLNVGYSALQNIRAAMNVVNKKDVKSILDFGCGYGRVLRAIRASFPNIKIVACDYEKEGVDFCSQIFNAIGIYSQENPEETKMAENFDLIWAGSLFTHFDQNRWHGALKFLIDHLDYSGILIFTTHGRAPAEWMRTGLSPYNLTAKQIYGFDENQFKQIVSRYEKEGFGYLEYSKYKNWGVSLSSPSWVMKQIEIFNNTQIIYFLESGWGRHQDVIGLLKIR
jgi:SAM-dependent methyltransferase